MSHSPHHAATVAAVLSAQHASAWLPDPARLHVEWLSSGAYHDNFLVRSAGQHVVARCNRVSQRGLSSSQQLNLEHDVLAVLSNSNVTPVPHAFLDGPTPILIESYLHDTEPFRYDNLDSIADAIAAVHRQPVDQLCADLYVGDVTAGLLADSATLLTAAEGNGAPVATAEILRDAHRSLATAPPRLGAANVVVHTDLIHTNLLRRGSQTLIVDWEGARVGPAAWDLAYFLSPITLRWAAPHSDQVTPERRTMFIARYADAIGADPTVLTSDIAALTPYVVLRALSWCVAHRAATVHHEPTLDALCDPDIITTHLPCT